MHRREGRSPFLKLRSEIDLLVVIEEITCAPLGPERCIILFEPLRGGLVDVQPSCDIRFIQFHLSLEKVPISVYVVELLHNHFSRIIESCEKLCG